MTKVLALAQNVVRFPVAVEVLLYGRVVDQPVGLCKVGQATHGQSAMGALKPGYADFADLAFRIGATTLVVSKMIQGMELLAPRTPFRLPDTQVCPLRNVRLYRLAWGLHNDLHEAGE
jgi:hypothetical protein